MKTAAMLAEQVDGSRQWTLKLIADVQDDEWMFQPEPGTQHVLWLCGHLAVAEHTLILKRCLGRDELDPAFADRFAIGGPIKSAVEFDYPSPTTVRTVMDDIHARTMAAVGEMSDEVLNEACHGIDGARHPHYDTIYGAVAHCARHEGFHAGQIALLRRLMGKPFLR